MNGESDSLTIFDDYEEFQSAWHAAAEERHPGVTQSAWNRDVDEREYGELNHRLHTAIRDAAVYQFADDAQYNTYQNWDWYAPTFECYVSVLRDHLTPDFVELLQGLLQDAFEDWTIVVRLWGDFMEAESEGGEVVIMSDHVFLMRESFEGSGLTE